MEPIDAPRHLNQIACSKAASLASAPLLTTAAEAQPVKRPIRVMISSVRITTSASHSFRRLCPHNSGFGISHPSAFAEILGCRRKPHLPSRDAVGNTAANAWPRIQSRAYHITPGTSLRTRILSQRPPLPAKRPMIVSDSVFPWGIDSL